MTVKIFKDKKVLKIFESNDVDHWAKYKIPDHEKVIKALGGKPSIEELERLVEHYPKYGEVRRYGVLYGFFEGMTPDDIVKYKIDDEAIGASSLIEFNGSHSKGGHYAWVGPKIKNLIFRILYIRMMNEGMSRIQARNMLEKENFGLGAFMSLSKKSIRTITKSDLLDK